MPEPLTFMDLRTSNRLRCEQSYHPVEDWSPTDWATAAAGELGEACNLIKKLRRGEPVPVQDIGDELADAVIYIDLLAARLGLNLAVAVRRKFNIVSERIDSAVTL